MARLTNLQPRFAALLDGKGADAIRHNLDIANLSYAIASGDLDSRWELGQAIARVLTTPEAEV